MPFLTCAVLSDQLCDASLPYWRFFARALTFGVRALVIDPQGRVFLIKHSYVSGWHLPGGGVEPGETMREALTRELMEEGNIELLEAAAVIRALFSSRAFRIATMLRCSSCVSFARRRNRSRTTKSSRMASSRPTTCRVIRPRRRGRALPTMVEIPASRRNRQPPLIPPSSGNPAGLVWAPRFRGRRRKKLFSIVRGHAAHRSRVPGRRVRCRSGSRRGGCRNSAA